MWSNGNSFIDIRSLDIRPAAQEPWYIRLLSPVQDRDWMQQG